MSLIFRKTAKGVAEIETRAHRLPPRMRSTLILVDGRRDAEDVRALVTVQADETLQALADQGFIEAVGETLRSAGPALSPMPAPGPARPVVPIDALRRLVARALTDELGPAAESIALRIERARSADDLRPLITQAVQLVQSARGRSAAEAFAARMPTL